MFEVLPVLTLLLVLHGAPVAAQAVCDERTEIVKNLVNKHREAQIGVGLERPGVRLIEIWTNCSTGTWTILRTDANGIACLLAAGENWLSRSCVSGHLIQGK